MNCRHKNQQRVTQLFLLVAGLLTFLFVNPPARAGAPVTTYVTPTKRVDISKYPNFLDDLNFKDMNVALERQIERYRNRNMAGQIQLGSDTYPLSQIQVTLTRFQGLVHEYNQCLASKNRIETCRQILNEKLRANFLVYEPDLQAGDPRHGEPEPVLFTAYYTPTIFGVKNPANEFPYAIYKSPQDAVSKGFTRTEIDFDKKLNAKGLEIFHTNDLFNLYLLHVQGGGKVKYVEKGKLQTNYLTFDGTNGKSWNFISKYMIEKKYIQSPSIQAQRNYLKKHPEKQEEIYSSCPSYVYFRPSDHPPLGSDSVPLTDNRSIATDSKLYEFKGLLTFVEAKRPVDPNLIRDEESQLDVPYKSYQRFYLDQDTGGAIRGKGRVDLYFGEGDYAEVAAYNTKHTGKLFFLMSKK